jgi:hypothetical protein
MKNRLEQLEPARSVRARREAFGKGTEKCIPHISVAYGGVGPTYRQKILFTHRVS